MARYHIDNPAYGTEEDVEYYYSTKGGINIGFHLSKDGSNWRVDAFDDSASSPVGKFKTKEEAKNFIKSKKEYIRLQAIEIEQYE